MRAPVAVAFAAGGLLGAAGVWLVAGPDAIPAPTAAPIPAPSAATDQRSRVAATADPAPTFAASPQTVASDSAQERRIAAMEADLAAARKEARANLLRGALVLEIEGHLPEDLLKPLLDVEPAPGVERFAQRPELVTQNPWMMLSTIVDEDFEEALQRTLDHQLRWTDSLEITAEEREVIRDYTERAFRTMVILQRKARTLRKQLADGGGLSDEARRDLQAKLVAAGNDHAVYIASGTWSRISRLFPRRKE